MSNSPSVEEQLREWLGQLLPEHKQLLLMMLTEDDHAQSPTRLDFAVSQLRRLCKQRNRDWDQMAENDRESFLDNLIRETEMYATQAGTPSIVPVLPCSCCGRDVTPSDLYRIYFGERPLRGEAAIGKLILVDLDANAQFPLPADNEITIGRVDPHRGIRPDIDLSRFDPAARISRRHARITSRGGQFYIEDLGSANGTIVNDRTRLKPQEPYPLVNGDVLKIGETTLKFAV